MILLEELYGLLGLIVEVTLIREGRLVMSEIVLIYLYFSHKK